MPRVLVIIHLCLVFTYTCYLLLRPLTDSWLLKKTKITLIDSVIANHNYFSALPLEEQHDIKNQLQDIQNIKEKTYISSLWNFISHKCSTFCLGWLFFSLIICISYLLNKEKIEVGFWILPIITLFYGIFLYSSTAPTSIPSNPLFPSQNEILKYFSTDSTQTNFFAKKRNLENAWPHYLIHVWGQETPSLYKEEFLKQLEKAHFAFQRAHIDQFKKQEQSPFYFQQYPSFILWFLYLIWNIFFAFFINFQHTFVRIKNVKAT